MTRNLITAEQVARRLGVRLSTVYAYVSRGVLGRTLANDGRSSRFDSAEVDTLARRGRPRRGAVRMGGVDVSLATSVTQVEENRLSYRAHDVTGLVAKASFEQVAELLWTGELPARASFIAPPDTLRVIHALRRVLPPSSGPLDRFAAAVAATAPLVPLRVDLRPPAVLANARRLIATFVAALPRMDGTSSRPPSERASIAERLWPRVSPLAPQVARVRLLDAALVLLADHELATSTMAVRVAASTRADPFAVVLAGLGALGGPLHGSAAQTCHRLLLDSASSSPEQVVARTLPTGAVPGFGHPVYRGDDPRAVQLLNLVREVALRRELNVIEGFLAAAGAVSDGKPSVDFALAAAAMAGQMSLESTDAIFAVARTAGWIAHAVEEYGEQPLRFRARAIYIGEEPPAGGRARREPRARRSGR